MLISGHFEPIFSQTWVNSWNARFWIVIVRTIWKGISYRNRTIYILNIYIYTLDIYTLDIQITKFGSRIIACLRVCRVICKRVSLACSKCALLLFIEVQNHVNIKPENILYISIHISFNTWICSPKGCFTFCSTFHIAQKNRKNPKRPKLRKMTTLAKSGFDYESNETNLAKIGRYLAEIRPV